MNNIFNKNYTCFFLCLILVFTSCKKKGNEEALTDCETININLFSLADDRALGAQLDSQLFASPAEYPILDSIAYPAAYNHLKRITNNILNSGKVIHRNDFAWKTRIIKDDSTLNAFCTPGGYIYVYTGIIKYLDKEDDLAGVMGHEIAHADLRHSTKAMTRDNGISLLLNVILGNDSSTLARIATGLSGLKYSRCHETEADEYSVIYLSGTSYKCNGAASFFEKIDDPNAPRQPEFLSTHPNPGNRVAAINATAARLNCNTTTGSTSQYENFKSSLP